MARLQHAAELLDADHSKDERSAAKNTNNAEHIGHSEPNSLNDFHHRRGADDDAEGPQARKGPQIRRRRRGNKINENLWHRGDQRKDNGDEVRLVLITRARKGIVPQETALRRASDEHINGRGEDAQRIDDSGSGEEPIAVNRFINHRRHYAVHHRNPKSDELKGNVTTRHNITTKDAEARVGGK